MATYISTRRRGQHAHWQHWIKTLTRPQTPTDFAVQSRYVHMLLEAEEIPFLHNIGASSSTWLLLAGYLVFPGTFTSLHDSDLVDKISSYSDAVSTTVQAIQNPPLLGLAIASCMLGTGGCGWLCWRWRSNFLWLAQHIFLPVLIHSATGLVNTLLNIYTARHGTWSVMAIATVTVTGLFMALTGILLLFVQLGALQKIKRDHQALVGHSALAPGSAKCHRDDACGSCQIALSPTTK